MSAVPPTTPTTTLTKYIQVFSQHSTPSSSLPILLSTPENHNDSALVSPDTLASNDSQLTIANPDIVDRDNGNDIDTDSGKSSCSPTQFDRSIDSGISGIAEVNDMQLHKRIQQCKRILIALERDKESYHILRDKLWKIVEKKSKRENGTEEICNVCCADINVNDVKSFVECCTCHKRVCRGIKCADWIPKTAQWQCQLCHVSKESLAQTSSWVADQLSFNRQKMIYPMRARSEIFIPISDCHDGSLQFESASQIGGSAIITPEQKIQIREYVEQIVAELLGGSLDNITVGKLSKSENYLQLFYKYHSKLRNIFINMENALNMKALQGDLPAILNGRSQSVEPAIGNEERIDQNVNNLSNISHARLRQLIESIIAETLRTPNLMNGHAFSEITLDTRSNGNINKLPITNGKAERRHRTEHYFEPQIYQDLLATAVLNKIVDTHGNIGNDNANSRRISESTPDLSSGHHEDRDGNYNIENQSTTSGSSIEPRSDCSYSDTDQAGNVGRVPEFSPNGSEQNLNVGKAITIGRESALSDYIATHMVPLPDLSAAATESEGDDQASASSSTLAEGTWEDNWLFKKRDSSTLTTSVTGGAMLVPAPKEVIRAQIGDKAADEASDLSEIGSETDDSSLDLLRHRVDPLNERVLNKHLIGGQNTKDVLDEILDSVSMTSTTIPTDPDFTLTETKNSPVIETVASAAPEAINSNITSSPCVKENSVILSPPAKFKDTNIQLANPLAGSIAEREYKKWYNAVDMPNNPYAPEALKKRISGSQERFMDIPNISPSIETSPITQLQEGENIVAPDELSRDIENAKRYSRDYYINDDKLTTGLVKSPQATSKNLTTTTAEDDIIINEAENANKIAFEKPISTTNTSKAECEIYQALPAQVVEDFSCASYETQSNPSLQSVNTTTSDDSDTVRVYDFTKQETTIIRSGTTETTEIEPSAPKILKKERPRDLKFSVSDASLNASTSGSSFGPSRGSTPTAFKFLQPKRKLIDPSQVMSIDEDDTDQQTATPSDEKPVIEAEVAKAMPSVKALARAFLLTSSKSSSSEHIGNRWLARAKSTPSTPSMSTSKVKIFETSPIITKPTLETDSEVDETASRESNLKVCTEAKETASAPVTPCDPLTESEQPKRTTNPPRSGILKSNIAFFENLKFK